MKFRILLLTTVFTGATYFTYAQTSDAEADALINLLGVQKKEAVAKLVPVTGKDSVAFWKIYDEYQQENKKTAKFRLALYEKTAQAYSNMTPEIADSLSLQYFSNRFEQEKSLETYYKKIKAATNSVVAFEFYQAEAYLLTLVRAQIMQQIPTYGHLVKTYQKK
jgi:D-hexose-6-phosphate mutarotase